METRKTGRWAAVLFGAALLLKYLLFGFHYYPVLDDFIQYGGYPLYHDLGHVYFEIGTMAARPLASLLDPVLWGGLWNHMWLALLLISVMHFFAVLLLDRALDYCGVSVGPIFWIAALFLPVAAEGAYWISASSRLVVGLFFAALGLYFLVRALTEGRRHFYILFVLFHLISYGFYEAAAIFSFVSVFLVAVRFWDKLKRKLWILVVPVLCLALLLLYYVWGAELGAMGSRAGGFTFSGLPGKLWEAVWQIGWIFSKGLYQSVVKGFAAGLRVLGDQGLWGFCWLVLAGCVCVFLAKICAREKTQKQPHWALFVCGLLLFAAPLAPNVLVESVWLPYRTVFISLIGLALMAETVAVRVFKNMRLKAVLVGLVLFVCLVANVNEYDTYRRVSERDVILAENIAERLDEEVLAGRRNVALIVLAQPMVEQVNLYKDHVKSVLEADWSLTGAVRAVTKNINIKNILLIPEGAENQITDEQVLVLDGDGHITEWKIENNGSVQSE